MKIIRSLLFLLLVVVTGCNNPSKQAENVPQSFDKNPDLEHMGITQTGINSIDSLLQSFVDEQKLNCVVGFVAKEGHLIYNNAFGWKDIENQVPASVDDYYVLFSQTKAITTVAFMTLVEKGMVNIDDPVSDYFPEIPNQVVTKVNEDGTYETRPVDTPMTFVHLMSHSSGLNAGLVNRIKQAERKHSDTPAGSGGVIPSETPSGQRSGGGIHNSIYLEEEMMALAKYPLGFDPGSEWNYHISTNMLGYLI